MKTIRNPLTYTLAYYGAFILLGMATSALGPSLPWLAGRTGSEIGVIGFLFTASSLGYMLGSLGGGSGYDRLPGHRLLPIAILVTGAGLIFVPQMGSLLALTPLMFCLGLSQGVLDVGGNLLLVWVHKARAAPFLNGLHFSFGLGAMIIPIIVSQALERSGNIAPAFWFMAVYALFPAVFILRLPSPGLPGKDTHIEIENSKKSERADDRKNNLRTEISETRKLNPYTARLVALISVVFFLYVGAEAGYGGWIFTYATRLELGDVASAGLLTSAFWGALMLGRLVIIPFANRLRPEAIILTDFAGCAASLFLILFFPRSYLALWVATLAFGFFNGPIFPTLLAFAERRMTMSGQASRWFFVGTGAGGMTLPWLMGRLFASMGPLSVIWAVQIAILLGLGVFWIVQRLRPATVTVPATAEG